MKARLMGAADDSLNRGEKGNSIGGSEEINFDELDALNSEMDQEMAMLMSQLGLVKGQVRLECYDFSSSTIQANERGANGILKPFIWCCFSLFLFAFSNVCVEVQIYSHVRNN